MWNLSIWVKSLLQLHGFILSFTCKGPSFVNTMKHDPGGDSTSGFHLLDRVINNGLGGSGGRYASGVWEKVVFLLVTWWVEFSSTQVPGPGQANKVNNKVRGTERKGPKPIQLRGKHMQRPKRTFDSRFLSFARLWQSRWQIYICHFKESESFKDQFNLICGAVRTA